MKLAIFNTHIPHESFACELNPPGCTLGRGPDNTIVLADELARISLIQAIIKIQDGHVRISNMGQQLIYINGESLAFTKDTPLQHDDQIRIAHYLILCDFAAESALKTGTRVDAWAGVGLGVTGTASMTQAISSDTLGQPTTHTAITSESSNLEQRPPLTVMPMSIDDNYHMAPNSIPEPQGHTQEQALTQEQVLAQPQEQPQVHKQVQGYDLIQDLTQDLTQNPTQEYAPAKSQKQAEPLAQELSQVQPLAEEESTQVAEPFDDPFSDFFSGPGVVPIGGEVDLHQVNPFAMESRASRTTIDPLEQIEAQGVQDASIQGEILSVFSQDGTEQHKQTIFTDSTPTTVKKSDTATEKKEEDLLDILHTLSFEEAMRHQ